MANLKNINFMSQDRFESTEQADDELYAVSASGIGFPSSRYEDLVLGVSGTEYTAPANGYFAFHGEVSGANYRIKMSCNNVCFSTRAATAGNQSEVSCPALKGAPMTFSYDGIRTTFYFRFIYAEGE